ncbi:uncharacterized protein LOC131330243 [Rhododendron vialii]|uniref:uncharacterized protein LOC131330243 n=1 Tax=Rhododendron vialii TaxID=182163 RepID=UPI00265DB1EE|nr:uncharacterized protein LOC131330243 [Rhododendron vialii]
MAGLMKANSGRGRQYGLMLILAFGLAILGVMAIHKLRERRILNLLVKEKDSELFSLQLLLKKEREEKKEAERKTEEMREKLFSLETENRELDSKILEMQSTISSLQDEQRTIGSTLEEKESEIKTLRAKEVETDKENARVVALTETLRQKEKQIQDLKNRLENPNQVLPVSTDDPSKQAVTFSETDAWSEEHEASRVKQESGDERTKGAGESLNESATYQDQGDTSRSGEGRGEEGRGLSDMNEITGGHSQNSADDFQGQKVSDTNEMTKEYSQNNTNEVQGQKISDPNEMTGEYSGDSTDEVQGEKVKDLQDSGMQEDKTNANKTETMANQGDKLRTQDESIDNETTEGKANGIGDVAEVENVGSQGDTSQQLVMNATGETKLEMADNSQDGAGDGVGAKHGNRYKELRDAELQKLDTRGNNQDADLKVKDESGQESENTEADGNHRQGESMEVKNEDGVRLDGGEGNNSGNDVEKAVVFADESGKGENNDVNQQIEKVQEGEHENFEKPNGTAADADKQKSDEIQQQSGENDSAVQQKTETQHGDKADQNSEEAEAFEVAEKIQDAETDHFRASRDEVEEDNESEEETDELEF